MGDDKKPKKFLSFIKRPHGFILALIYIAAIAAIVSSVIFVTVKADGAINYVGYGLFGLAAILLGYVIYTIVIYAPTVKKRATEKLKKNSFTSELVEDYIFRTVILTFISIAVTIAFATMNLVSAVKYKLVWYAAIAGYYFVLLLFRVGTVVADRICAKKYSEDKKSYELSKWRIYLAGGGFLVILEIAMAVAVTQLMLSKKPMQGGDIMAIATAAYTFYKVVMSVINLFKARRFSNPVTQSIRNLNFADSFMSLASLTVLMIHTFSEGEEDPNMVYIKATIGFVCCAAIIAIATYMIIKGSIQTKKFKQEKIGEI